MRPPSLDQLQLDACALCSQATLLCSSHIIPHFVFDWLRESSGTGHIRTGENPNRRVQDSWKPKLLCRACEQMFGRWEKAFAEHVFVPLHRGERENFPYGPWMLKFAASISWRILTVFKLIGGLDGFPPKIVRAASAALSRWRDFLLDQRPHPGRFEQHMLLVDLIIDTTIPNTPPNINRYLLRSIEIHVAHTEISAITYAKMGRVILFGFFEMSYPKEWQGTKLHVNSGTVGIKGAVLPSTIGDYMMDRARRAAERLKAMSPRQRQIVRKAQGKDLDRIAESESFRALYQDITLFGRSAFGPEEVQDGGKSEPPMHSSA